jgi:hypothetical protein
LPHLIRFGHRTARLQIQDFLDAFAGENVVASANAFLKSQASEAPCRT